MQTLFLAIIAAAKQGGLGDEDEAIDADDELAAIVFRSEQFDDAVSDDDAVAESTTMILGSALVPRLVFELS